MKSKRIITGLIAALMLVSVCACQKSDTAESGGEAVRLKNYMTETEKNSVSIGELTLLDGDVTEEASNGEHTVEIEWWTDKDYRKKYEKDKETNPEMFSEGEYEKLMQDFDEAEEAGGYTSAHRILVDGRLYSGFHPLYEYDGGKLEYWISGGTEETKHVEFDSFNEFKKWYRNQLDEEVKDGYVTQETADQTYADMPIVFQSVIDATWKELSSYPSQTASLADIFPGSKSDWEYKREEVEAIKDSVREMSIYDEELESNFIIHITLPPNFDEKKKYPMFVMSDGVWRFGNCPSLRKLMEDGETEDVILVTIGYDYSVNGTEMGVRAKYFYEEREKFIDFITNNLTPYLSEMYNIDFERSAFYGHSAGGVLAHNAVFTSDLYENQPFKYYIIGSPALWQIHRLDTEEDPEAYKSDYGYWDRNETFDKIIFACGGENEDPEYEEYYDGYDTTLEGIAHLMERLKEHGDTKSECKIYENSGHWQFIPDMFVEFFRKYYGKN